MLWFAQHSITFVIIRIPAHVCEGGLTCHFEAHSLEILVDVAINVIKKDCDFGRERNGRHAGGLRNTTGRKRAPQEVSSSTELPKSLSAVCRNPRHIGIQ